MKKVLAYVRICLKPEAAAAAGVDFTNVLQAAFTHADPKSAKKLLYLTVFFALLGSVQVKAAHRMLVKLTQGEQSGK